MNPNEKRTAQQVVVIMVAAAACIVVVGGFAVMAYCAIQGKDVPGALDKYSTAALVAALGLLAKLSDSRAEAKDAAAVAVADTVKDLEKLSPPPAAPTPVTIAG